MNVLQPSCEEVTGYLKKWELLENYVFQERSLNKLFTQAYPLNTDIEDVLIKVSALNDFYSTNIFSPYYVAKHIVSLNIDPKLKLKNLPLVNEIALVKVGNDNTKNFYSFATKYCSHHFPDNYPIYDSYVIKMLKYFKKQDGFCDFKNHEINHYPTYYQVLHKFRCHYQLEDFSLKQIDKYLWQAGKYYFPKR